VNAVLKQPELNLRPMADTDISDVLQIEHAAYAFPWNRNIFKGCLREDYCCRIVELDGGIAGYAIMSTGVDEAHLLNLCVDPGYHRTGLGDVLLNTMLDYARKQEAVTTFLEVRPSNKAARRFYEKRGFVEVGLRANYYPAKFGREDAIIMAREMV
jgi:ribosomal-protein-alanine N-acetyltransferase